MATGTSRMESADEVDPRPRKRTRWGWRSLLWAVPLALVLFVVISDLFGWAYLREPIAGYLSARLERQVEIDPPFRVHLRPRIPIRVAAVRVAAPDWSKQPHFLDAEGIEADLAWGVLLGRTPVLHRLAVDRADIRAQRDGEGRASWSMGSKAKDVEERAPALPVIKELSIGKATIEIDDAISELAVKMEARAGSDPSRAEDAGLVVNGSGSWRREPVSFELRTKGLQPVLEGGALPNVDLKGKLKSTELAFAGSVSDLTRETSISGKVSAKGPSLGELTVVPGLTLPSTPPYRLEGDLERSGKIIKVNAPNVEIGSSRMQAQLEYDGAGDTPLLRGSIGASRLVLQDLGPTIGALGGESDKAKGGESSKAKGGESSKAKGGESSKGQGRRVQGNCIEGDRACVRIFTAASRQGIQPSVAARDERRGGIGSAEARPRDRRPPAVAEPEGEVAAERRRAEIAGPEVQPGGRNDHRLDCARCVFGRGCANLRCPAEVESGGSQELGGHLGRPLCRGPL